MSTNLSTQKSYTSLNDNLKQIEKDVPRTQSDHPTFKSDKYRNILKEVLVSYCKLDYEIGYVQGMNIIASVVVYHGRSNYECLRVFDLILKKLNFR
jgi:hypothetical protein